jgi:hypothetical protein
MNSCKCSALFSSLENLPFRHFAARSLGLSATSQQYFSLRTDQPPATSRNNQSAVLFSQNKPAPAISHQPTEQAVISCNTL